MKRLVWLVLALVLVSGGLQAQGVGSPLVGSWGTVTNQVDRNTGKPVQLHAMIEFKADSTYVSILVSDDGSGEPGILPPNRGQWAGSTTAWGVPMICVRGGEGAASYCHTYEIVKDSEGDTVLLWGGYPFWQLDTPLEDLLTDSICQDQCLDS